MVNLLLRIDWVFVDIIIIILLILLLIGVRFFKSTHRWRLRFSNNSLEYHSFHKTQEQVVGRALSTKYWDLTKNTSLQDKDKDDNVIIILRTTFKKKLVRIFTEGLSSYGFNVISLKIKIIQNLDSKISTESINDELQPLISSIINKLEQKELLSSPNYILLNFSDSLFPNSAIFSDSKNTGFILLNPKMNKTNVGIHQEIYNRQQQDPQLFYIFSKRSFFIFKNNKLKLYKKNLEEKSEKKVELIILEKSNSNFKYYETILLGILIDIIESKLIKSKNHD
jgi:hypothetical protein